MFSVSGQGRSVGRSKMYGNSGSLVVHSQTSEKISMVKTKRCRESMSLMGNILNQLGNLPSPLQNAAWCNYISCFR